MFEAHDRKARFPDLRLPLKKLGVSRVAVVSSQYKNRSADTETLWNKDDVFDEVRCLLKECLANLHKQRLFSNSQSASHPLSMWRLLRVGASTWGSPAKC